jgi:hypothetical protein
MVVRRSIIQPIKNIFALVAIVLVLVSVVSCESETAAANGDQTVYYDVDATQVSQRQAVSFRYLNASGDWVEKTNQSLPFTEIVPFMPNPASYALEITVGQPIDLELTVAYRAADGSITNADYRTVPAGETGGSAGTINF